MRQVRRLHLPLVCLQVQGVLQVRRGGGGDLRDVLGDISTNELTVLQEGSRSLGGHSSSCVRGSFSFASQCSIFKCVPFGSDRTGFIVHYGRNVFALNSQCSLCDGLSGLWHP
jgi:hypothetical protein